MSAASTPVRLLVLNAGSSSLKFEVLEVGSGAPLRNLASGAFAEGARPGAYAWSTKAPAPTDPPTAASLGAAAEGALDWLANPAVHGANLLAGLSGSAHRVVHGGEQFRAATRLGPAEIASLEALSPLAPLHNPPALAVIGAVRRRLGASCPLIGVFDTAYYADLPPPAYRYAVPADWATDFGVRRYGFHGIAHGYMNQRARVLAAARAEPVRTVTLQLGRGCSITASVGDHAVATSMGFTPLEGLVMGTRSGDIDAGAVLYVLERTGMSAADMRKLLNERSGLLGLSGRSADMRELLELERVGDPAATLAIECFCRRARHYVGGFLAELGGADAIVFGGGIGENCSDIRQRIVGRLGWAGIALDAAANETAATSERAVHAPGSRAGLYVVPVDEATVIAREAAALLARAESPPRA